MKELGRKIYGIEEMRDAARFIIQQAKDISLIYLQGNLGAGKTFLCKAILQELGYSGLVSSPTYGLMQPYFLEHGNTVNHLDLYRIKNESELLEAGIYEVLLSGEMCLIEWPEILLGANFSSFLLVEISYHGNKREIVVKKTMV
jgi:tRNA threonylcarbamoyladenosine biosynthesis protein TsaE